MDPKELLQNRNVQIGAAVAILLIIVVAVVIGMSGGKKAESGEPIPKAKKLKESVKILTTSDSGKALEIQALLARAGITVRQGGKGSKIDLILSKEDEITEDQRDVAIMTIVKSGIMDKNIGLEIFDKGDFTSSREDKRIRLARAVNGELARLIKKIPGIEDASVFVAIPKDTIFTSMKKPKTATVQLVLSPDSDRLDRTIIRAITNLLLGSIEDLDAKNVSITDTNGNVYTSIMNASDDMMKLLEDKDNYMKKKIMSQLDKLVGKGNYVVTVSTYLRETPIEMAKVVYDPEESTVGSKQRFTENLGDQSEDKNKVSGAVSSFLPKNLTNPESKFNRNYTRAAEEYSYKVGQTRISEYKTPGILEEISIAVTLNRGALPTTMDIEDFKSLVAKTASPKALAKNVKIAFSNSVKPYLTQERPVQLPEPDESGNPWWTLAAVVGGILFIGLIFISGSVNSSDKKHQKELENIKELAAAQQQAIQEANQRASQLQQAQQQMYQQITSGQMQAIPQKQVQQPENAQAEDSVAVDEDIDEAELATSLKSWIETSS